MRISLIISIIFILLSSQPGWAQVTMGSNIPPAKGALLDLKQSEALSNKGLSLPRVNLQNIKELTMGDNVIANSSDEEWNKHIGLIVYNVNKIETATNRICPGIHVWDGNNWIPLIPYSDILSKKTKISTTRSFKYLESDPTSSDFDISLWPADKQSDALSGKYKLGHSLINDTDNLLDVRGSESNSYYTSRFYVGYKYLKNIYNVQESYKCDETDTPVWIAAGIKIEYDSIFSDGVWTTQSLNTTKFPDGADIPLGVSSPTTMTSPLYMNPGNNVNNAKTYGRIYNWPTVINMGSSVGQTPNPGTIDQGGNNNDILIQGICPVGWHVPNAQEWVDLFNGIADNITLFSSVTANSGPVIDYTTSGKYINPSLRKAMVSTMNSNKANESGFYATLAGRENRIGFGSVSYFWSSSSASSMNKPGGPYANAYYMTNDSSGQNGVIAEAMPRNLFLSVRCMRDTQ